MTDEQSLDLEAILARSASTLWQDAAGVVALMVLLVAGLNLPIVL